MTRKNPGPFCLFRVRDAFEHQHYRHSALYGARFKRDDGFLSFEGFFLVQVPVTDDEMVVLLCDNEWFCPESVRCSNEDGASLHHPNRIEVAYKADDRSTTVIRKWTTT